MKRAKNKSMNVYIDVRIYMITVLNNQESKNEHKQNKQRWTFPFLTPSNPSDVFFNPHKKPLQFEGGLALLNPEFPSFEEIKLKKYHHKNAMITLPLNSWN